jgi:plastocyanin
VIKRFSIAQRVAAGCGGLLILGLAACGGSSHAATPNSAAQAPGTVLPSPSTSMPSMPAMNMGPTSSDPPASAPAAATTKVVINNFAFSPAKITVKAGTTVSWVNKDEEPHTVFSQAAGMRSQTLAGTSNTYAHTFMKAGTYGYNCTIHPFMHGTVVVTS